MSDKDGSNNKVIGLVSGNGVGKTTLSECLLFNSKTTDRLGRVDDKNTVSDFSPMEEEKGFSISSSIMHYKWKDFNINIIDSPGYIDFVGQSQSTIKVSDSVIMVIDAKSGIQAPTEMILDILIEDPKPMFIVLNKMDLENIEFFKIVEDIRSTYNINLVPITIPVGSGENFSQIVDILQNKAYQYKEGTFTGVKTDIDPVMKDQLAKYNSELIESIVETNDELLNKYLEGKKIEDSVLSNIFKKAVVSRDVIPVFAVSAAKNSGIDLLMDYINILLPSPLDMPPIKAKIIEKDEEVSIKPSFDGPPLAYVFKTMADPYIGKLTIFRIFSGTFKSGENYRVSSEEKPFKFGNLFKLQGKKQIETSEATCGDIVAVSKLMKIT
ncbi:MAG: GTP-binding protein, partial [Actinobacteria bacterium]|nr:GTP-binding protein [Actinomycetota bacterium]